MNISPIGAILRIYFFISSRMKSSDVEKVIPVLYGMGLLKIELAQRSLKGETAKGISVYKSSSTGCDK